jgi:hypothetical protein
MWPTSPTPEDSGVEDLDVSWTPEGLLLWKGRYVVPDYHDARLQVLENRHDSPVAGHPGENKTSLVMDWSETSVVGSEALTLAPALESTGSEAGTSSARGLGALDRGELLTGTSLKCPQRLARDFGRGLISDKGLDLDWTKL